MFKYRFSLLALIMASTAVSAQPWEEKFFNPKKLDGDIVLPMPCEGSMVFRVIKTNTKKPLEDIIVFNEEGVTIRREGNNLILSMPELILFDFDKYIVKDKIKPSLSTLAKALGENKDIHIKIDGYTDFIGTEAYNLELSVKRANAIKDFLISRGAIGSNISIEGYGEQNPADTNQTAAGRSRN